MRSSRFLAVALGVLVSLTPIVGVAGPKGGLNDADKAAREGKAAADKAAAADAA